MILANVTFSQTSTGSTPPTDRAKLVSLCEKAKDEVIASRTLIASYEDTITKQEAEQTLTDAELLKVREALGHEKKALEHSQLAIAEYKKALAKEVKKKNFYKAMVKGLVLTTGVLAAFVVLRN